MPFFNIFSTSSSIIFCMAGLRGRYRCLIGRSVLTRIVCSILCVRPLTCSNVASSFFKNLRRRTASAGSCGVMPAKARPGSPSVVVWCGGGIARPKRAHKSIPLKAGLSKVGRMLNVCTSVLPCRVTGSETRPVIVVLEPSAKWISPGPSRDRIFR